MRSRRRHKLKAQVSSYAVPARVESVEGLPSTYIDTGGLDLFRDEDIDFAARLAAYERRCRGFIVPWRAAWLRGSCASVRGY